MADSPKLEFWLGDRQTSQVMRLTKYLDERLAQLRRLNDVSQLEEKTATLRGRIAEVKKLIELCEGKSTD